MVHCVALASPARGTLAPIGNSLELVAAIANIIIADVRVASNDALATLEHLSQVVLADYNVIEDGAAVLLQD